MAESHPSGENRVCRDASCIRGEERCKLVGEDNDIIENVLKFKNPSNERRVEGVVDCFQSYDGPTDRDLVDLGHGLKNGPNLISFLNKLDRLKTHSPIYSLKSSEL